MYCIGGQKCGTGWLYSFLRQFKQVSVPVEKELQYWRNKAAAPQGRLKKIAAKRAFLKSKFEESGNAQRFDKFQTFYDHCEQMYLSPSPDHSEYADALFQSFTGQDVVIDVSPHYAALDPAVFKEMARLSDGAKFLFLVRDPVARAHSSIRMKLKRGGHAPADFREKLAIDVLDAELSAQGAACDVVVQSRYEKTLQAVIEAVPPDRFKLVFFEDFFELSTIDEILAFLQIEGATPRRKKTDDPEMSRDGLIQQHLLKKTHIGFASGAPVSDEFRDRLGPYLAETYAHFLDNFGDALPAAWIQSARDIAGSTT